MSYFKYSNILLVTILAAPLSGCVNLITNFQSNTNSVAEEELVAIKKRPLVCAVLMPKNSNEFNFSAIDHVSPFKPNLTGNIGNFVTDAATSELGRICADGVVVTTSPEIAGSMDVVISPVLLNTQIGLLDASSNKDPIYGVVHLIEYKIYTGEEYGVVRQISALGAYKSPSSEIDKMVNDSQMVGDYFLYYMKKWTPYLWSKASTDSVRSGFRNLILYIDKQQSNQLKTAEKLSNQPDIIQRKISALSNTLKDENASAYFMYSSQNSFVTDMSYYQKRNNDSSMISGALVGSAMKMMPNSNVSALGSVIDKMYEAGPSELRDAYNIGRGGGGAQTLSALRTSEATTKRVASECEAMGAKLRSSTSLLSNEKIGCEELKNVNSTIAGLLNSNASCAVGSEMSNARRNFDITKSLIKRRCGG